MSDDADDTTDNSKITRKLRKLKKPAEENKENSSTNSNSQQKPIKCPYCSRTFQLKCHLKYHSVVHQPGRETENGESARGSGRKRSGRLRKSKSKKAKEQSKVIKEARTPESVIETENAQEQDIYDSIKVQIVTCDEASLLDASNAEESSPIPISNETAEDPPQAAPSAVQSEDASDIDTPRSELPVTDDGSSETELAAIVSPVQTEDTLTPEFPSCHSNESPKVAQHPEDHTSTPGGIECQLQPSKIDQLSDSTSEASPLSTDPVQSGASSPAALEPSRSSHCLECVQLGRPTCYPSLVLSPNCLRVLENPELLVDKIDLPDAQTPGANSPAAVARNSSGLAVTADGEGRPPSAGYFSDNSEDMPHDYREVLGITAPKGSFKEG